MGHGGIIAVLLDEAMGKVCRFREARAVTAEMNIQYLKPVRVDEEITVEAFETDFEGAQYFSGRRNSQRCGRRSGSWHGAICDHHAEARNGNASGAEIRV